MHMRLLSATVSRDRYQEADQPAAQTRRSLRPALLRSRHVRRKPCPWPAPCTPVRVTVSVAAACWRGSTIASVDPVPRRRSPTSWPAASMWPTATSAPSACSPLASSCSRATARASTEMALALRRFLSPILALEAPCLVLRPAGNFAVQDGQVAAAFAVASRPVRRQTSAPFEAARRCRIWSAQPNRRSSCCARKGRGHRHRLACPCASSSSSLPIRSLRPYCRGGGADDVTLLRAERRAEPGVTTRPAAPHSCRARHRPELAAAPPTSDSRAEAQDSVIVHGAIERLGRGSPRYRTTMCGKCANE